MIKLLMNYANDHNIRLNINEKNVTGHYPLHWSIFEKKYRND